MTCVSRRRLASRLQAGECLTGVVVKMPNPALVELVGHLGFDVVLIDTEHGNGDPADLEHHLRAADAVGVSALVRVGDVGGTEVLHALDSGAEGIVAPHVASAAAAHRAVATAHYAPKGTRGLAVSTRAGGYGTVSVEQHVQSAMESTVVIAQVEDAAAVTQCGAIASTEGISAIWIGTSDLALSLGYPGEPSRPEVQSAIDQVVGAAVAAHCPIVVLADSVEAAQQWRRQGAGLVLFAAGEVLATGLRAMHAGIRDRPRAIRAR